MSKKSQRVRVCFVVDSAYAGGAERYVKLLALGLDRDVFDPVVLAKVGEGLDEWCVSLDGAGVAVRRAPMNMPFSPLDAVPVFKALSDIDPHVVHVNVPGPYDGQMGLIAPLARLAGTRTVIVTEHLPRVERLWKRAIVKDFSYQWVDKVLTICTSNVEQLIARQGVRPDKIEVIYNGVAKSMGDNRSQLRLAGRRRLELHDGVVGIVYVGSLIARKGLDDLLAAVEGIEAERWRLFVVGSGEREADYKRVTKEKGMEARVRFLGSVDEKTIEEILCAMDVLVLPSFMEGMPYVILEAMACSLPVVSTLIDGIPEAAPDNEVGLLVEPGDVAALRGAIARLVSEESLRFDLGANARRRFEKCFTLENHIERMEELYLGAAGGDLRTRRTPG